MFIPPALSRLAYRTDDLLRRRDVWRRYESLLPQERISKDELRSLQLEKLRRLLSHAGAHSPYFRELFRQHAFSANDVRSLEDLGRLPLMTRETLRARGADVRSSDPTLGPLLPNSTGGSTGSNVHFWVDRDCWRWRDATFLTMWKFLGLDVGAPMISVWGSPMDLDWARSLQNRLRMVMDNRRLVSAYKLSDDDMREIAQNVMRVRPAILHGYPSVLDLLATRVKQGAVRWKPIPNLIVVSAAETLYAEQRRNIAEVLGARVFNLYGCREFGLTAMECPHGTLHVMAHRVLVETLPESDASSTRIIVTDLDNRGFPFIRYDIGDTCEVASGSCPCGRSYPGFAKVSGRTLDVVRGPTGQAVGGTFWSLLLRTVVSGIDTWQVVQLERALIEIRTTPKDGLSEAGKQRVQEEVRRALGDVTVRFRGEDSLPVLPSGKHRFIVALRDGAQGGTTLG